MATAFNESYYLKQKIAQLATLGQTFTEDSLKAAIEHAGMTVEQHYDKYATQEGTSANPYFNTTEYLEAKLAQLNSIQEGGHSWTMQMLMNALEQAGLTAEEHYQKWGCKETDADGKLINPSNAFDANAYVAAKLAQLQATDPEHWAGKSAMDVLNAITAHHMSPVTHYEKYGAKEANADGVAMVQTVPVVDRVANDPLRAMTDDNVPSNYNASTAAPASVSTGHEVTKPADMGGLADESVSPEVVSPESPVATPSDPEYVEVPGNGIVDTNEQPVVLVESSVTDANGNEVKVSQFGVETKEGNVQPVTDKGVVDNAATPIQTTTTNEAGETVTTTNVSDGENSIKETTTQRDGGSTTTTEAELADGSKVAGTTETAMGADGVETSTIAQTVTNPDGSTVETAATETKSGNATTTASTVTSKDKDGNVTGSTESTVVETANANGSTTTKTDAEVKDANGNTVETISETATTAKASDGSTTTTKIGTSTDADGNVTKTNETVTANRDAATGTTTTNETAKQTNPDGSTVTSQNTEAVTTADDGTTTTQSTGTTTTKDAQGNTSSVATEATKVENPDGSGTETSTTTATAADGSTVETTSSSATTVAEDGTKTTETKTEAVAKDADGATTSTTTTEAKTTENTDGTSKTETTAVTENADGTKEEVKSETTTNADGSSKTTTETTTTDAEGNTETKTQTETTDANGNTTVDDGSSSGSDDSGSGDDSGTTDSGSSSGGTSGSGDSGSGEEGGGEETGDAKVVFGDASGTTLNEANLAAGTAPDETAAGTLAITANAPDSISIGSTTIAAGSNATVDGVKFAYAVKEGTDGTKTGTITYSLAEKGDATSATFSISAGTGDNAATKELTLTITDDQPVFGTDLVTSTQFNTGTTDAISLGSVNFGADGKGTFEYTGLKKDGSAVEADAKFGTVSVDDSGAITFTPDAAIVTGVYTFKLSAKDGSSSDEAVASSDITITVKGENEPTVAAPSNAVAEASIGKADASDLSGTITTTNMTEAYIGTTKLTEAAAKVGSDGNVTANEADQVLSLTFKDGKITYTLLKAVPKTVTQIPLAISSSSGGEAVATVNVAVTDDTPTAPKQVANASVAANTTTAVDIATDGSYGADGAAASPAYSTLVLKTAPDGMTIATGGNDTDGWTMKSGEVAVGTFAITSEGKLTFKPATETGVKAINGDYTVTLTLKDGDGSAAAATDYTFAITDGTAPAVFATFEGGTLTITDTTATDAVITLGASPDFATITDGTNTKDITVGSVVTGIVGGESEASMTVSTTVTDGSSVTVSGEALTTLNLAGEGKLTISSLTMKDVGTTNKVAITGTGDYTVATGATTQQLEGSANADHVTVTAGADLSVEMKGGADSLTLESHTSAVTVVQGKSSSVAASAVDLTKGSEAEKYGANDVITFADKVDTVAGFGASDKIDFGAISAVTLKNLSGEGATITAGTYVAYGKYVSDTGAFTLADNLTDGPSDALVFSIDSAGEITTADNAVVLIGISNALSSSNIAYTEAADPLNP